MLKTKRVYEDVEDKDGYRILVDKVWPRGISKEDAELDHWAKDIAPSDKIRKEFDHDEDKFDDFKENYLKELSDNEDAKDFIKRVKEKLDAGNVTLLYGAKDKEHNQAVVLKDWLKDKID